MKRIVLIVLFLLCHVCQSQTSSYLDSIFSLQDRMSKRQFVQTIVSIEYDKALTNSKKYLALTQDAEKIALELGDQELLAKSYAALSLAYHFSSKFDMAIEYTLKSAKLYQQLDDIENYADSYISLGWKIKNRDLEKALFYMMKGILILEKSDTKSIKLIGAYNNYGVLKQRLSQFDSAYYYHKKSLDLCVVNKDSIGIPFAQTHIAEVYIKKKQFDLAEQYLNDALQIRKNRNDVYGITDSQLYLGDLHYAKKEYRKAIIHFKEAEKMASKNHYFPLRKYALEYLYKSYDKISDTQNAFLYYKTYTYLKDSILNKDTNTRIAELEIQFQTAEKEKEIVTQKEQILENELTIKTRNLYAIVLGFALITLGIISFGVYKRNQFRRKQLLKELALKDALATIKTQNKLQEQRLRISQDLHDNIGSQLTFITSSLDNLKFVSKEMSPTMQEKLTGIGNFTTDTIDQLRDTIWAMNRNEITSEDLHNRMLNFISKAKNVTSEIQFNLKNTIPNPMTFSSVSGMHIFRIFQEGINNALKYSNASTVNILLENDNNSFTIYIEDNGIGFDLENVTFGNGLLNMKKRALEASGKISVNSKLGNGTSIILTIPLQNTSNDV
ncbi:sensor histidine kinase [Flavobacteriaceae bacterium S356]|uniref:histidine kinase n=1 Tax=Asprobacillus argus TaxID=3076534 RepID=A0ABU3LBA4_9FLAO|nr:sensor histidine kinase [Flavobacteriaceae bacterium S356]